MKIGLVRHFKVNKALPIGLIESKEFTEWIIDYNNSDVIPIEVDLGQVNWDICYTSQLSRAITTAKTIYDGEIVTSPLLNEIKTIFTENFHREKTRKRDFTSWSIYSRISWGKDDGEVVEEPISETRKRADDFLNKLFSEVDNKDNVLLVCHGMLMTVLDEKLREKGFSGERVVAANNGELFVYEGDI